MSENWGNHIAIVVEGILRQPNDSGVIIPGLLLYKSLVKDHRISLIFDSHNREKISYWLLMNGMTEHVREVYYDELDPEDAAERRLLQIGRLRKDGPLSLVLESDTSVAAALLEHGIASFLFLHPQYTNPTFRPGHTDTITPWNQLLAEKKRQLEARATDTRFNDF